MLKEAHLGVKEHAMRFLSLITDALSELFAFPKDVDGSGKYLLDRCKTVCGEVPSYLALFRLRIVVTIEVKDPKCIEVRMDRHVESI